MGDRIIIKRLPFSLHTEISPHFHTERAREPLSTLHCPRKQQLWRWWCNGMDGHHIGRPNNSHVFDRISVTTVRYRDEVLEPNVRLFPGCSRILQDDRTKTHRALLVDEFLESEASCSSKSSPSTSQELKRALLNEWAQ